MVLETMEELVVLMVVEEQAEVSLVAEEEVETMMAELGSKRVRKIGIIAVARKLLIALWRFLETGVLPEGAELKASPMIR